MKSAPAIPPPGFDALSVEEKIDYVHALWDRIAADQKNIASPDWHRDVLRERLADHQSSADRPWSEVSAELTAKLKN